MADDRNNRGPADAMRIDVNEEYELRYWTETLDVSEDKLRTAVSAVGVMVQDVRVHLGKPQH